MTEEKLGGKVELDVTSFKTGIQELNRSMAVINSGFRATAAGMDDWSKSSEGLKGRMSTLNGLIGLQEQKVNNLKAEFKRLSDEGKISAKEADNMQIKINNESASLNKLQLELSQTTTKLNDFGKETKQAAEHTSNLGNHFKTIGGGLAKGAAMAITAVAAAATAATVAISKMVMSSAENAGELQKFSDQTGFTAEKIQELAYVGKQIDLDFETLIKSQTKLTRGMAQAREGNKEQSESFKKLSISIIGANGELRDSKVVMLETIDALGSIGNETERDALSLAIFGKSALELNPLIKAGSKEIAKFSDEAHKNGAVLSNEGVKALDDFGDSIESLQLSAKGLAGGLSVGLLPSLNGMVSFAQSLIPEISNAIKSGDFTGIADIIGKGIVDAVGEISKMVTSLLPVAVKIISSLAEAFVKAVPQILPLLITAVLSLLNAFVTILKDNGPMLITAAVQAVTTLVIGIMEMLPTLIPVAIQLIMTLVQAIVNALPQLIPAAIQMIVALINGIIQALPQLIEMLPIIIQSVINSIVDNLPLLIDATIQIILAIVFALIDNLPLLIQAAYQIIGALIGGLLKAAPQIGMAGLKLLKELIDKIRETDWIQLGKDMIRGMIEGLKSMGNALLDAIKNIAANAFNAIKDFFGIKSPSRLMRDKVGKMIGLGLVEGIVGTTSQVAKAMAGLTGGITGDVSINGSNKGSSQGSVQNYNSYGPGQIVVSVPVNGIEIARAVLPITSMGLGQNSRDKERALGVV